jgi:hypothetical protein
LAFGLIDGGDGGRGSAWLTRARDVLDEAGVECAERGLLLLPAGVGALDHGDVPAAMSLFGEVWRLGRQFGDVDVITLAGLGRGQSLIALGDQPAGMALLDEAMVAVGSGALSPPVAGLVACGAIATCQRILDVARAREWTAALTRWCDAQRDLVPYRGQCLVHRAEVFRLHGAWDDAAEAVDAACAQLSDAPAAGDAWYERAELYRLRGELDAAESAYRAASRAGRDPQPGLALLRLAQGDVDAALGSLRRRQGRHESRGGSGHVHQRKDRRPPPQQRVRQARCAVPRRGHGVGVRAWRDRTVYIERPTRRAGIGWFARCGAGCIVPTVGRMLDQAQGIDQLSQALVGVFRSGKVDEVFTDDVFLDRHPPFWRFQIEGLADLAAWLAGYVAHGPDVTAVRTVATVEGFLTEHITAEHDPDRGELISRKLLVCAVRDGRIAGLTVYCSGDWDSTLRARHAAEAPILRP